ncbi:MAG: family 1 extracellular solute-binding protein [Paenibacillus sp.]|uniref:ABC transporter substrate-binding protein n=1 Tax=Paenibacillus sp. GCM10012303 TaxID=3317340 RepID=UPI0029EB91AD|nr:family 1 extracellular solute-binding protein [Paenibacillus sp.]
MRRTAVCVAVASMMVLWGCSGSGPRSSAGEEAGKEESVRQEPVTLSFYSKLTPAEFETYIARHVRVKFPHVTLQQVEQKSATIQDLITVGNVPDIIWEGSTNLQTLTPLKVMADLRPLAEKHKFDFGRYRDGVVDNIRSYSENGQLYFLPFNVFEFALHYNKDVFNKFGVPFPKDHMTWDEVISLAGKMNRQDNGVQYVGMRPPLSTNRTQMQLSLPYVDAQTGKAAIQTEGWKRLFDTIRNMYPGPSTVRSFFDYRDEFLKQRTVGMMPDILQLQNSDMAAFEKEGLEWDVVTYPAFADKPKVGAGLFSDGMVLSAGSKHVDLAFQIISYISTDPEVQLNATRDGRVTALKDPQLLARAFENNPAAAGKNLKPLSEMRYPASFPMSDYDRKGLSIVESKLKNYVAGKGDVNTLLREAEEQLEKAIAEQKSQ